MAYERYKKEVARSGIAKRLDQIERQLSEPDEDDLDQIDEILAREQSEHLRETIWEATRGLYPQVEVCR